jgi:succinate dehydrogenase hydrophobic anchor subunit
LDTFVYAVVVTALVMWLISAVPYTVVIVVMNLVYRASTGRFFRWFSAATVVPFLALLLVWIAVAHAAWSNYGGPK